MRRDAEEGGGALVHMVHAGMAYWLMVYFTDQRGREGGYRKLIDGKGTQDRSELFEMREVPSLLSSLILSVHLSYFASL